MKPGRRHFLLGAAAAAAGGALGLARSRIVEVRPELRYPGRELGHALREGAAWPAPSGVRRAAVAILGSGVAGLSCAWKLAREGWRDFVVVSGPETGGNAAGGRRRGLDYPLGAHYLPLPSMESVHVREMLAALGILERGADDSRPWYDEAVIVHAPQERLLRGGRWEDSLLPMTGLPEAELAQHRRFLQTVAGLHAARGADGRKVFAIPVSLSSRDPAWRALDGLSLRQWLRREGYDAPALLWYLDYCCRDDYGADSGAVSAWAGLHYFASRDGHAANAGDGAVLTWPGGLSALVAAMRADISARLGRDDWLLPGSAVRIEPSAAGARVVCAAPGAAGAPRAYALQAGRAVCAMPVFVAQRLLPDIRDYGYHPAAHAPPRAAWLVSNFVMDGYPPEMPGEPLSWDNVVYQGQGLGYVVSTHQLLRVAPSPRTVFTAYHALSGMAPAQARRWLENASPEALRAAASADLTAAYGDAFWRYARELEITVRGHAMATPAPGYLSNPGLLALREADGPILFAHADLSGYSVFEEAAWWGVTAAARVMGGSAAGAA